MANGEHAPSPYYELIGDKGRDYYLERFAAFDERGGGLIPSWNWAAFLFGPVWALYRKMYAVFFVTLGAIIAWEIALAGVQLDALVGNGIYVAFWIAFGLFGNALYYRHAGKKIARAREEHADAESARSSLQRAGGVHVWVIWTFSLVPFLGGVVAGIAVPAFQDYSIRAQVGLGLGLAAGPRTAVMQVFDATGELPADNEAAGLLPADRIVGDYVSNVEVNGGNVLITYGNQAHPMLQGRTLLLQPDLGASGITGWTCSSRSILPQHLPAACR